MASPGRRRGDLRPFSTRSAPIWRPGQADWSGELWCERHGTLASDVAQLGFALRGAFHPVPEDGAPALSDGAPAQTVVLLGQTGGDQWPVFSASQEANDGLLDPLNRWSKRLIDQIAADLDGSAFYPFGGPPWLDFQRWALKAEPVHPSPLGLLIHPKWGLWHSYRGALGLRERFELGPREDGPNPCNQCSERPCLSACPVSAFAPDSPYNYAAAGNTSKALARTAGRRRVPPAGLARSRQRSGTPRSKPHSTCGRSS